MAICRREAPYLPDSQHEVVTTPTADEVDEHIPSTITIAVDNALSVCRSARRAFGTGGEFFGIALHHDKLGLERCLVKDGKSCRRADGDVLTLTLRWRQVVQTSRARGRFLPPFTPSARRSASSTSGDGQLDIAKPQGLGTCGSRRRDLTTQDLKPGTRSLQAGR